MKVKFNLPTRRYNSSINFDNNTTFGFGNLQPLFCKFVLPKSKFSCNLNQLTRLSPLVVPTFARLKQINDFVYVNINKVMPSFDAFLSNTLISGVNRNYTPSSLPCTTNYELFCDLISKYALVNSQKGTDGPITNSFIKTTITGSKVSVAVNCRVLTNQELKDLHRDFIFSYIGTDNQKYYTTVKLTQSGRYWYSLLRGLGYSLDYNDNKPVSILPLWAFAKAYYDIYYPKRYNPWHASNYYNAINRHYNGEFTFIQEGGQSYDMIPSDVFKLPALFGNNPDFTFYGVLDNDVVQAALSAPLNSTSPSPGNSLGTSHNIDNTIEVISNGAGMGVPYVKNDSGDVTLTAESLSLVNRLWSFVSRSSVVGQSVKDWFKVHFGIKPSEDMFESSVCFAQKPNFININSVVSNSDTKTADTGARLGDLAGQALSNISDKVSFDVPNFGFVFCISGVIPLSRVSGGTQCELYNTRYYDMPFPDFDGLGYETLNNSSFVDPIDGNFDNNKIEYVNKGFGYVPRFTSYKMYNNVRSGGFSLPSIKDTYMSYCEDTIVDTHNLDQCAIPTPSNLKFFFPWRYSGGCFVSYDRIFYNQFTYDKVSQQYYIDDNFMCQTAFDCNISSYLKPISDSYSIESLGKQLVSVKRQ